MSLLKVGIVGLQPGRSWASRAHVPALRAQPALFELHAVANTGLASTQAAAADAASSMHSPEPPNGTITDEKAYAYLLDRMNGAASPAQAPSEIRDRRLHDACPLASVQFGPGLPDIRRERFLANHVTSPSDRRERQRRVRVGRVRDGYRNRTCFANL